MLVNELLLHRAFAWIDLPAVAERFGDFCVQHGRAVCELTVREG